MKLLEVIESDEFDNQDSSLNHLFRVQQARTYEFILYLNHIAPKVDWAEKPLEEIKWYIRQRVKSIERMHHILPKNSNSNLSKQEINKYYIKYQRMIDAKRAFDTARQASK